MALEPTFYLQSTRSKKKKDFKKRPRGVNEQNRTKLTPSAQCAGSPLSEMSNIDTNSSLPGVNDPSEAVFASCVTMSSTTLRGSIPCATAFEIVSRVLLEKGQSHSRSTEDGDWWN